MIKNKKIIKISIAVFVLALVIAYITAFISVNTKYPPNKTVEHNQGSVNTYLGSEFKIKDAYILNREQINNNEAFKEVCDHYFSENGYCLIYCVTADFHNVSDEKITVPLENIWLVSGAFSLQIFLQLSEVVNGFGVQLNLNPYETKEVVLTYAISDAALDHNGIDQLLDRDYTLVYSLYPDKNTIPIKFDKT